MRLWCHILIAACLHAGLAVAQEKVSADDIPNKLLQQGSDYWIKGDPAQALEKFRTIVKKYPTSKQAGQAQFYVARLYELNSEWTQAFAAYEAFLNRYKDSPHFTHGIQGQFLAANKIFDRLLEHEVNPLRELPKDYPSKLDAAAMFKVVLAHARHGEFAAKAQYRLAVALEQAGFPAEAKDEHESIVQNFPTHHLADDAAFQSAYIDAKRSRRKGGGGTGHTGARQQAVLGLEYFLFNYPESEKTPLAVMMVAELRREEVEELGRTARYYADRGKPESAVVYWKEVLKQPQDVLKLVPELEAEAHQAVSKQEGGSSAAPEEPISNAGPE